MRPALSGALDLVITNASSCWTRCWASLKADIGIKDGRIVGLGKAGNPDVMDGVTPELAIGPGTEVIAGEHLIATPGGDRLAHPHDRPAAGLRGAVQRHHDA